MPWLVCFDPVTVSCEMIRQGSRNRTRSKITAAADGGKPCGPLLETKARCTRFVSLCNCYVLVCLELICHPRPAAISAWIVKLLTGQLGRAAARAVMVVCQIELAQKCTLAFPGLWMVLVDWCSMFFSLSFVFFALTAPSESGYDC